VKKSWVIFSAFGALSGWMLGFVAAYAVNLFHYDIWDVFQPSFGQKSTWDLFSMQFGSQRIGLGILMSEILMRLSQWNARAESFAVALTFMLSAGVALRLKWKLFREWSWWDLLLVFQMLSLASWESIVGTPFLAFSSVPLLLILLSAYTRLIANGIIRAGVTLLAIVVMLYSSQSILAVPAMCFLMGCDFIRASRRQDQLAILVVLILSGIATFYLVATHDRTIVGTACFDTVVVGAWDYLLFVGAYTLSLFGWYMYVPGVAVVGIGIFFGLLLIWLRGIKRLLDRRNAEPISEIIFFLLGFTLLHGCAAAYGRACLGTRAAYTSRYFPYMLPGYIAVYFWILSKSKPQIKKIGLGFLCLSHLVLEIFLYGRQLPKVKAELISREAVRACLVEGGELLECEKLVGFQIHPSSEKAQISGRVEFLRNHRLGPFQLNGR